MDVVSYAQVLCTDFRVSRHYSLFCLILTSLNSSCKNVSMITTSFIILDSPTYFPFQPKTCSSAIELITWYNDIILCVSQTFTFLVLPMGSKVSSCLDPIKYTSLKLHMHFTSQVHFLSKFLIMTKSPVL